MTRAGWAWGGLFLVALGVAAVAQDGSGPARRKPKPPTRVDVVQSVPLEVAVVQNEPVPVEVRRDGAPLPVVMDSLPPVDVASLPEVTVAELPAVAVSSLPSVTVSSLPSVTVANSTLDVRVTNDELPVAPAGNKVVEVADLDGVTLDDEYTSEEIDCDGYREFSVFIGHDDFTTGPSNATVRLLVEFYCGGVWARHQTSGYWYFGETEALLVSSSVLGTKLRITLEKGGSESLPFPTINNVKAAIHLRR